MPLAAKKNQRTQKVTPAVLDVEPAPIEELEPVPAQPKITALVYSYNNEAALRRCLTALEASDARAVMEILVVDKGSTDGSANLDTDFPNATFMRLPRNFGNTKALNIGMRTGVGELVLFLSPEVEVRRRRLGGCLAGWSRTKKPWRWRPFCKTPRVSPSSRRSGSQRLKPARI